ncbi:hypothetical protein TNCV_2668701 [Trichonephila clavipes]|nr:hypothetical protein TNCV_2668701 [Trichonephila clavipes]
MEESNSDGENDTDFDDVPEDITEDGYADLSMLSNNERSQVLGMEGNNKTFLIACIEEKEIMKVENTVKIVRNLRIFSFPNSTHSCRYLQLKRFQPVWYRNLLGLDDS